MTALQLSKTYRKPKTKKPTPGGLFLKYGVTDGTRTHDNRNHNPGLYQLSYGHH